MKVAVNPENARWKDFFPIIVDRKVCDHLTRKDFKTDEEWEDFEWHWTQMLNSSIGRFQCKIPNIANEADRRINV